MNRGSIASAVLTVFLAVACFAFVVWWGREPVPEGLPTNPPAERGWVDLLRPELASAWAEPQNGDAIFEIVDGELHIFGGMTTRCVAFTQHAFRNYELHLEYRLAEGTNSGVYPRGDLKDESKRGVEVQILDDSGQHPTKNRSGAIYGVATPMYNLSRPAGEWNSLDITMDGIEVIVVMNGWRVIHTDLDKMTLPLGPDNVIYADLPREGYLMLQDHGGEIWFRNIRVHERSPATGASSGAA